MIFTVTISSRTSGWAFAGNGVIYDSVLLQSTTSYSRGAANPPLIDLCIGQVLDQMAARYPDSPALILRHENLRYTWSSSMPRSSAPPAD